MTAVLVLTVLLSSCGGPPQAVGLLIKAPAVIEAVPSFHSDNDSCEACHESIYAAWRTSRHAEAWRSETFRITSENYALSECLACHAPDLILRSGVGNKPALRADSREGGVTCIVCHQDATADEWKMHGPYEVDSPGHDSVANTDYVTSEVCASCHGHDAEFNQYHAWESGPYGQMGFACHGCHMPQSEALLAEEYPEFPRRSVGDHSFPGAHSDELVSTATKLTVTIDEAAISVSIENQAGHDFPGGAYRTAVLTVTSGEVSIGQARFSYEGGTRIPSGETATTRFVLPTTLPRGTAEITLRFHRIKASPDGQSVVFDEDGALIAAKTVTF